MANSSRTKGLIPKGIVYIFCPGGFVTGGPEAIHQLASSLNKLGRECYIVYYDPLNPSLPSRSGNHLMFPRSPHRTPEVYAHYAINSTETVVDGPDNLFIVTEIAFSFLQHPAFENISRGIWWLSVDNGLRSVELVGGMDGLRSMDLLHLCQSHYAELFLLRNGIANTYRLFDYTTELFTSMQADHDKVDAVAYNPKKGGEVIERLRKLAPDIKWMPLVKMSAAEVQSALSQCKLYVDFGQHPGKDRIPREAALCGCSVLTNRRGSAGLFSDLPIPARYKLDDSPANDSVMIQAIRDALVHHAGRSGDFDYWRRCIRTERAEFELQVTRLFG